MLGKAGAYLGMMAMLGAMTAPGGPPVFMGRQGRESLKESTIKAPGQDVQEEAFKKAEDKRARKAEKRLKRAGQGG